MSWSKDYSNYCRYCERWGRKKHLYYYDVGLRSLMYFCKKCGDKHDPDTYQRNCVMCHGIYHQSEISDMCDECVGLICNNCVKLDDYYKCFRCNNHSKLCDDCVNVVEFNDKDYVTCKKHLKLGSIQCSRYIKTDRSGCLRQCKHITGPDKKFCKQHRYQQKRRRYIKK